MSVYKYPFLDLAQLNAPYISELKNAAASVIDSGRYVGGAQIEAFENELARAVGVEHVVAVSNGLDALRLIFKAYIELGRLAPGDEVIVPANTYIASVLAVSDAGLTPVLVEPREDTLNLDTSLIESAVTARTKAILTVHLYGRVCYDRALAEAARRHGLIVVEDNAQAIGAQSNVASPWGTTVTGSLGEAAAFSFYPTKNLGALGDAGAVSTHNAELARVVRALANYGSDRRYHNIFQGYNCRMDPVQAAFLRAKMPFLSRETNHRRELARIYHANIDNELVVRPLEMQDGDCVWHQYVVQTPCRDAFRDFLAQNGVETDVHYAVPPHRQPCYAEYAGLALPVTDRIADRVVSLPISSCTSIDDAKEIAQIINRFDI